MRSKKNNHTNNEKKTYQRSLSIFIFTPGCESLTSLQECIIVHTSHEVFKRLGLELQNIIWQDSQARKHQFLKS